MLTTIEVLALAFLSVVGALFSAVLGWLDSGDPFNARKFTSSILRAIIAGIIFAAGSFAGLETVVIWDYFVAFVGGAGIEVVGNRLAGAIKSI